ncbi:MAG TPA: hypothetical protein VNX25_03350 [Verrucomicrobiae bacterium]|nr:hypothetical protein [Verrucomicrobiae bacterium]
MRHIFLIPFFAAVTLTTACSTVQPPPQAMSPGSSSKPTACQKADAMWNDKILPTVYAELPPLTDPGVGDVVKLAQTGFTIRSLTNDGDEMDEGRRKVVHAWGAEARFRFVPGKGGHGYTGIYQSASDCVIGRLSVAAKPTKNNFIPALALKFFITGHDSANLQVMNSTSGQSSHNFFEMPFSNIIPPAESPQQRLLQSFFRKAAEAFGAKDPDPAHLTVEHLAKIKVDGGEVANPKWPYRLVFKPTAAAAALMQGATVETDFRANLARYPAGQAMYDVYGLDEGESAAEPPARKLLGQLIPTSGIVASSYGDERLNFRHNMER